MNIVQSPITMNRSYNNKVKFTPKGIMLHSIGVPQPKAEVIKANMDTSTASVSVHYIVDNEKILQLMPDDCKAWHCGKGSKGSGNDTHISIEMTEPNTIKYLAGSAFTDSNPTVTKAFVSRNFYNAVNLCAELCKKYSLNPATDIISHAEGYRAGIASNHMDPDHLFLAYPENGLTMDIFRGEVAAAIATPYPGDEPKPAFLTACKWAVARGLFLGDSTGRFYWHDPLTREQLAQILYRLFM